MKNPITKRDVKLATISFLVGITLGEITFQIHIALAEDTKDQQPANDCGDKYTMYTHPDKRCREKLAEEYKALIKQILDREGREKHEPNK